MTGGEKRKLALRFRDRRKAVSTTAEDVDMDPVKPGWKHCVQQVAVANETTAYTRLRIGAKTGDTFRPLEDTPSPEKTTYYTWKGEFFLFEGEVFTASFMGATANDLLEVLVFGYRQKMV